MIRPPFMASAAKYSARQCGAYTAKGNGIMNADKNPKRWTIGRTLNETGVADFIGNNWGYQIITAEGWEMGIWIPSVHMAGTDEADAEVNQLVDAYNATFDQRVQKITDESKHTPGPWEWHSCDDDDPNRWPELLAGDGEENGGSPISEIVAMPAYKDYPEGVAEANMALIAAAPEMLAELKAIWEKASNHTPLGFDDCSRIRKLIIVAEGSAEA